MDLAVSSKRINRKILKLWKQDDIVVTQGFIAKNKLGHTTTLGREGSDYTAAIFAYALEVDELTIWKDVKGILTADPRRFDSVQLIKKLSYREAIEMTYFWCKGDSSKNDPTYSK